MPPTMPSHQELLDHRQRSRTGGRIPDVAELQTLAKWMDSVFVIPGLNIRFGLDSILGLFPGLGDVVTSLIGLYILQAAAQKGVPRVTMARMGANILLDWAVGSIPVVGDAFDVYWKSNNRNVELLRQHVQATAEGTPRPRRGDWLFFLGLSTVLLLVLIGSLTVTYFVVTSLGTAIRNAFTA